MSSRRLIELPHPGRNDSTFAIDVAKNIPFGTLFRHNNGIVEVVGAENPDYPIDRYQEGNYTGMKFRMMDPSMFALWVELHMLIGATAKNEKDEVVFYGKSMSDNLSKRVLKSPQFGQKIPLIKRILDVPIPVKMVTSGRMTVPEPGYNKRLQILVDPSAPKIKEIDLEQAKDIILNQIYQGFCFKDEQSKVHAIARLLTPFARGMMGFEAKTPLWYFNANRPRAGKDYCAGITQIVYQGAPFEDAAIGDQPEETRKRITAFLMSGRRMVHFANCQGHLDDPFLTQAITGPTFNARMLGSTNAESDLGLPNEIHFSLSANVGITYREDIGPRCRTINLAYFEEDPNSRTFPKQDLHGWVLENRGLILSAIFTIFKEWGRLKSQGKVGKPPVFTSMRQWAEIVGGAMIATGLGNPCLPEKDVVTGGDLKTSAMEALYFHCYNDWPDEWIGKDKIFEVVSQNQEEDDRLAFFGNLGGSDSEAMKRRNALGLAVRAFDQRRLGDIVMALDTSSSHSGRHKLRFTKIQ